MNKKWFSLSTIITMITIVVGVVLTAADSGSSRGLSFAWIGLISIVVSIGLRNRLSEAEGIKGTLKTFFTTYIRYVLCLSLTLVFWIGFREAFCIDKSVSEVFGEKITHQLAALATNSLGFGGVGPLKNYDTAFGWLKYITLIIGLLPVAELVARASHKSFLKYPVILLGFAVAFIVTHSAYAIVAGVGCVIANGIFDLFGKYSFVKEQNKLEYGWLYAYVIAKIFWKWWVSSYIKKSTPAGLCILMVLIIVLIYAVVIFLKERFFTNAKENTALIAGIKAILSVTIIYVLANMTTRMAYHSVDDGDIQTVLSGAVTGSPCSIHPYINQLLSFCISKLYLWKPEIQWWYIYSQALTFIGTALIHYCVLRIGTLRHIKERYLWLILVLLDLGLLVQPIVNVGFTIVPATVMTAVMVYFLYLSLHEKASMHRIWWTIPLLYLATLHRFKTAQVLFCFVALALIYLVWSRKDQLRKKLIYVGAYVAIVVALVVSSQILSKNMWESVVTEEYTEFSHERVLFTDYPVDTLEENPELYASVGWDEDIYYLATHWCFIPDEINSETLSYINENSVRENILAEKLNKYLLDLPETYMMIITWFLSFVASAMLLLRKNNRKNLIFWLANNIGMFGLVIVQLVIRRILFRTVYIEVLPCILFNIVLLLQTSQEQVSRVKKIALGTLVWACVMGNCLPVVGALFSQERRDYVTTYSNFERQLYDYAISNPDNIYISSKLMVRHTSGQNTLENGTPSNLLCYGDTGFGSPAYLEQWKKNGIDELTCETFKQENVYFIVSSNMQLNHAVSEDGLFMHFYEYMKNYHNAIGFVKVDSLAGKNCNKAYVYHFVFEENKNQYNEYWDIVNGHVRAIYPNFTLEAHRGYCQKYPENTTLAFEKAAKLPTFSAIETDVQETKDGELVCMHDFTIEELTDGTGAIADYTLEELQKLHITGGHGWSEKYAGQLSIATLEEYLDICIEYDKIPYVELKVLSEEGMDKLITMLDEKGLQGRAVITSNYLEYLDYVYLHTKNYQLEYMTERLTEEDLSVILQRVSAYPGMVYRPHVSRVDDEMVTACAEKGIALEVWGLTTSDGQKLQWLLEKGIQGATCNGYIFE